MTAIIDLDKGCKVTGEAVNSARSEERDCLGPATSVCSNHGRHVSCTAIEEKNFCSSFRRDS